MVSCPDPDGRSDWDHELRGLRRWGRRNPASRLNEQHHAGGNLLHRCHSDLERHLAQGHADFDGGVTMGSTIPELGRETQKREKKGTAILEFQAFRMGTDRLNSMPGEDSSALQPRTDPR